MTAPADPVPAAEPITRHVGPESGDGAVPGTGSVEPERRPANAGAVRREFEAVLTRDGR